MTKKIADLSHFANKLHNDYGSIQGFPLTPISDAEFRVLFEKIVGSKVPYTLKVNYWKYDAAKIESGMSRVDFLDFTFDPHTYIQKHITKNFFRIDFMLDENYELNGREVDKNINKLFYKVLYPFQDILRETFTYLDGCSGIGGKSYFNGGIKADSGCNWKVTASNPDLELNKLMVIHWFETYSGWLNNIVRKDFMDKMAEVFKEPVEPIYHDQSGTRQVATVVEVDTTIEGLKSYLFKAIYGVHKEGFFTKLDEPQ